MIKGDKKVIRGWVSYDWANSVYNLVISSAIFPIFFEKTTTNAYVNRMYNDGSPDFDPSMISVRTEDVTSFFFGIEITSSVLYTYVLAASFLVVSFLSPLLSGIADYSGNKKAFMKFFCYLGATSCVGLYFFDPNNMGLSMIPFFLASIGFWSSLVFYNSFLPEISEPKDHDRISAKGFSMGYFGGMVLLVFCLIWNMVLEYDIKYCFVFVGIWWVLFSQIAYRVLPNSTNNYKKEKGIIWKGFNELIIVFKAFKKTKRLKRFITSFFFFNTGVQTVMLTATLYASREIFKIPEEIRSTLTPAEIASKEGEGTAGLIIAILLIQILGALGAFLISRLSEKIGNMKTLTLVVGFWIPLCVFAYFIGQGEHGQFYALACGVGIVMGGVQSLSRSTYAKFLPETNDYASYFSFFDVTEKIGIVLGTFFFGFMEYAMDDIRGSILSIIFFFVIGLLMIFRVPKNEVEQ
ncbi:MAG: MFS transporter [Crocinitomicaceae bacterium]|nr:MFS transporter [Crocinitomicaceae bacterium]MDG1777065.1 MFS transporter [Crocinitomicaceae bacterium]